MESTTQRLSSESTDEFDMGEATALLSNNEDNDPETTEEKVKYPRSVFFIISNEFCERFSFYGMKTILVLYLNTILNYSDDDATIFYHVFNMLCYFFPIFGAMLADSLLGKFRTIFYLSLVYAAGNVIVSVASATGAIEIPARELSIVGLLLIAIGTGGIKPCVAAFGGDQFKLPQQEKQLQKFFSLFYFSINSGSLISTFLTPVLREDVKCFGNDTCYPLAFGIPAALMVVSLLIFLVGKRLYIIKKPEGNVILRVCKCIGHAVVRRNKVKKHEKREHWLDYADDTYDKTLINDVKATLRVLLLFIPVPIFWALFDQQGSRWTFQATRTNGELGNWALKPDQMQVINPLLILAFIPLFETVMYPLLAKCNLLTRPLQRFGVGGLLGALAFVISAILELQLEGTYAVLPGAGQGQLRVFNGLDCPVTFTAVDIPKGDNIRIESLNVWNAGTLSVKGEESFQININLDDCQTEYNKTDTEISVTEWRGTSYFLTHDDEKNIILENLSLQGDIIDKSKTGEPVLRVIYNFEDKKERTLKLKPLDGSEHKTFVLDGSKYNTSSELVPSTTYAITIDDEKVAEEKLALGGVYSLVVREKEVNLITVTEPNSIHMLWMIPQYFVLTMAEVMFSITGLEFSFTQAPVSMKSVLQACWLLTIAIGNLVVIIVAEAKIFESQAYEFFLFAGLMVIDMGLFVILAMRYKYVNTRNDEDEEENNKSNNGLALKERNSDEKNGLDNATFKSDEQG